MQHQPSYIKASLFSSVVIPEKIILLLHVFENLQVYYLQVLENLQVVFAGVISL